MHEEQIEALALSMKLYAEEIEKNPELGEKFLQDVGIYDKEGNVTPPYLHSMDSL